MDTDILKKFYCWFHKRSIFIWLSLLLNFVGVEASPLSPIDSLKRFVKNINAYNYMFPREQVYLHFDNTGYFMGETIWYKAYVVNPQGFRPTAMSRVLYVELLTPEGRIVQQQKLKIENGQCHGQIPLSEVLHAGFYEVRAYTALMLNWEDAPIFSRVFPIFNAPKEVGVYSNPRMGKLQHSERLHETRKRQPKADKLNVAFLPEGGKMVEGVPATVFFKATDRQGNAREIKGRILNQNGKAVCDFSSSHEGMGRFTFIPDKEENYYAEVFAGDYTHPLRHNLPASEKRGYVMTVNNLHDDHTSIQLARNENTDTTKALGLSVMCRGQIVRFKQVEWQGKLTALIDFPKQELPEGVNQVTLFDTEGHIHAERLFFIFPRQGRNISLVGEKNRVLKPKEAVSLDFLTTDSEGIPRATTFSLAIRDADTETPTNGVNGGGMMTNLLLGSELKGYIHNIDYYLEADDLTRRTHLDLLLGTQGWRKYDWESMTRPQDFVVKHHIEEGIMVVGDLTSTFRNRKKEGVKIKVFLFNEAGYHLSASTLTDSMGRFAFQAEDFTGRWQMHTLTYENGKAKEMNVNLDKIQGPQGRAFDEKETMLFIQKPLAEEEAVAFLPDSIIEDEAEERIRWENLLPTVNVKARKEWQTPEVRRWHTDIYDMEDERMLIDETGEEYLENFWIWLMKTNPYFGYTVIGPPNDRITVPAYKSHPIKFRVKYVGNDSGIQQIDDWIFQPTVPAEDGLANLVESLTINDVDAIAISDKPDAAVAFYGDIHRRLTDEIEMPPAGRVEPIWVLEPTMNPENKEGIHTHLAYVTLFVREGYSRHKDKRGHRKTKIQGFSPERRFYIPDYSDTSLPDEPDFRRTLYWNPNVVTDQEGKATVTFYNSPNCRHIKISTETFYKR